MSRKPSFAHLRNSPPAVPAATATAVATEPEAEKGTPARVPSREGRKQIAGFFTPDMSLAMHMLARRQGRSLQALMAESFNDVLRKYGESPIGE